MLTLEPAFAGNERQDLLRRLANDEPRPPRSLDRAIPVELETIVLKAISKSPADRYASAQALADDLQRFLDEKPILARRPTLVDRARKWSRRHPSAARAGVAFLILVIAGLVIHNRSIDGEKKKAQAAYEGAERRFQQAREAVDLLIQVSQDELADRPDLSGVRKKLLTVALEYYQDFIAQRQDDQAVHEQLAAVEKRVKDILADLSVLEGAGRGLLLTQDTVIRDLQLTPKQRGEIASLLRESLRPPRPGRRMTPEQFRSNFLEGARRLDKGLANILTEEQQARLKQIALQFQGLRAFHDLEIVEALHLTADQRAKIHEIEVASFGFGPPPGMRGRSGRGPGDGNKPGAGGPHLHPRGMKPAPVSVGVEARGPEAPPRPPDKADWRREDFEKVQREAFGKVLQVLHDDQAKTWQQLTGKPLPRSRSFVCHDGPEPR
jgi:hypothetical protein